MVTEAGCYRDDDCRSGLCRANSCRVRGKAGDACADINALAECAPGLSCRSDKRCAPRGDIGAPCETRPGVGAIVASGDCRFGLHCLLAAGATTGTCQIAHLVDDACATTAECDESEGLRCRLTEGRPTPRTCQGAVGVNDECKESGDCLQGLSCQGGRCMPL
jgi:hypothetical protein